MYNLLRLSVHDAH